MPCYRDSQQLDKGYCPEAAALCSRALLFTIKSDFARPAWACPARQWLSLWGNGDDRRQRRKQGGAVGAAASRMQATAKQTLGAATRAVSPKVTERARPLQKNKKHSDSIALTKGLLIAAQRLSGDGLALSVIASQCHLSQRERLWHPARPKAPPLGELSPKVTERAIPDPPVSPARGPAPAAWRRSSSRGTFYSPPRRWCPAAAVFRRWRRGRGRGWRSWPRR